MTHPGWFASGADATGTIPAVTREPVGEVYGGDDKWEAALGGRHALAELADDPGPVPAVDPAWATDRLSRDAQDLHGISCGCEWGGNVEDHYGVDFEQMAEDWKIRTLAEAVRDGVLEPPAPRRAPVEAKVKAGGWASLAVAFILIVGTPLLEALGVIGVRFGGQYPWVAIAVLVAGPLLQAAVSVAKAYGAPHTPRTEVDR